MVHGLRAVLRLVHWGSITRERTVAKFDKAREEWAKLDEDGKIAVVIFSVLGLFVTVLLLILIVALIKELFVPALIALAVYSLGAKKWGWPVPKKIKQFFVK